MAEALQSSRTFGGPRPEPPGFLRRYGAALGASGVALLAAYQQVAYPAEFPFFLFLLAVTLSAWYGGLGPGLLSAILAVAVADYYFLRPIGYFNVDATHDLLLLILFVGASLLVTLLCQSVRRAWRVTEDRAIELQAALEETRTNAGMLDAVFAAVPVGLTFLDRDLRCVRLNEALATINGTSSRNCLELPIAEMLPTLAARLEPHARRVLETGEPVSDLEVTGESATEPGRQRHWLVSCFPVRKGSMIQWVGVTVTDVTRQKRAEEELIFLYHQAQEVQAQLREHAVALEQRVVERTADLRESYDQLEAFSYSVSHDLRAPIRAIQGYTEIVLEELQEHLSPASRDYGERILKATRQMDRLIQDLLTFSRLGRAALQSEAIDVTTAFQEALAQVEPIVRERRANIELDPGEPVRVVAHRATLVQAIANLLSNAVKFVAPDRTPQVRLSREIRGEVIRLWIQDNGLGIAEQHHERIFGVFERLHGGDQYPGTGVGLAIVRKGVERMGGRVGLESEPGRGSRFWIDLPRDQRRIPRGEAASSPGLLSARQNGGEKRGR